MTPDDQAAIKTLLDGAKDIWPGCYRGKVEEIDDPDRLGRVRVRVWAVHRDDDNTPVYALPWAEVSEIGGGGYDYGSFNPPPVGSGVWVMFEGGHSDYPVVVGTFRGVPKRDENNPNVFLVKDEKPSSETAWTPPDEESETPKDVFEDVYNGDPHPTKRVWAKSYKGHTIVVEDGDGKESFKIIDRAGQVIAFDCPVAQQYAKGNAAQRGVRDALRGDQLPHDAMQDKRASIRIRDLSGQEIVLNSRSMDESITIRSKGTGGNENSIVLRSGKGKDSIEIVDTTGNYLRFDPHSDTPIVLKDTTGNAIIFDKESGQVRIVSSKVVKEEAPRKQSTISGSKTSNIRGNEEKEILGNKRTRVVNDVESSVMGNAQVSLGGALKMILTNKAPSGSESKALDIQIANATGGGDVSLNNLKGDITIETKIGDVELSTLSGDATLKTSSGGNANVDATTGKVILGSSLLPEAIGSQEKLVKGDTFNQTFSTFLTTMSKAHNIRFALAQSFAGILANALSLNIIPAVGNTLFTILAGAPWLAYVQGEAANLQVEALAEQSLKAGLTAMLSTKTTTQ